MATSIGEGAARGIEAGFGMGQQFLARRDAEEQRKRQQEMQAQELADRQSEREFQRTRLGIQDQRLERQDLRQAAQDERQQNLDAEAALDAEFKDLQSEGRGLFEQYGDMSKIPKDLADSYTMRVKDTRGRLTEARAKRYAPLVEKQRQEASQLWSKIQSGQIPIEQVPDDQLVSSLTALTRRDITDLIPIQPGLNGKSPVQQAGMDFMVGAQTGNDEMMLGAANVLFKPELMIGVGGPGRDGSEILSKKIVQLIPHPEDPTQFTPLLEVKVRREDGKVGTYRAPVTENRSSDPNDNIKTISMQDGLDRVGQLTTLAEALNQRGIIEKIANGINTAGDGPKNFLEAYYATGGQKPKAEKVDVGHFEDFGGYKIHYLPDGRQVRINKTATPTQSHDTGGETGAQMRNLAAALKDGTITQEEYNTRKRAIVLGTDKGKNGGKPLTEGQSKANVFGSRMAESNAVLEEMLAKGVDQPGLIHRAAQAVAGESGGTLTNFTQSDEQQQVEQAQRDFVNATLRRESGAAISPIEFANAKKQYFPQPGDGADVKERKARNRKLAIDTMLAEVPEDMRTPVPSLTGHTMGAEREARGMQSAPGRSAAGAQRPSIDLGPSRVPSRQQAPVKISSKAEFDALPSGATFIAPDGTTRRKP